VVELMVGIIGFAIIALTVGSMLVSGWMAWRRNTESIEMQRNAMVAMRILELQVRNSTNGTISGFGTQVLAFEDGSQFSSSELSAGSFVNLDSFSVSSNDIGGVQVVFTLSTVSDTDQQAYTNTVYPRN